MCVSGWKLSGNRTSTSKILMALRMIEIVEASREESLIEVVIELIMLQRVVKIEPRPFSITKKRSCSRSVMACAGA